MVALRPVFSIKSKSSNNWVISVTPDLYPVIKDQGYLLFQILRELETYKILSCNALFVVLSQGIIAPNTQALFRCSSTDDHDQNLLRSSMYNLHKS
ncbi:hypothetical protein TNCV_2251471 [Trichonephila clavipes]|nr:hypothetical protein TNCV_2251471 [Trichonephila clavipes]